MDPQNDDKVATLLGGLKRVNAPENFESRVRARLSDGRAHASGKFGWLKLALPTAALAGLALFLFLSGYLGGEVPEVNVATEVNKPTKAEPAFTAQNPVPSNAVEPQPQQFRNPDVNAEVATAQPSPAETQAANKVQKNSNRIRTYDNNSYDMASNPQKDILPRGLNTDLQTVGNSNSEKEMRRPTIAAADILRITGIISEFRGNDLTVSSTVKSSVSERIGVKPGDVIVSLNDIKMAKNAAFPSGVDLKTIRLRRNGQLVDLKF
jgi:hypothetical protein